jgi:glutathione S-transferase
MLRILGRASSINVRKVLWTCREIGIAYSREDFGTGFAPTDTPEFLGMNPNGQVPVIEDEEGVLWESNTICRYLAAKHARTDLLPAGPRARASGVDLTFATHLAANSMSECQILNSTRIYIF